MHFSLEGKLALFGFALVGLAAALVAALTGWFGSALLGFLIGLALVTPFAILGARYFMRPVAKTLRAVSDGIVSLTDRDFSVSITMANEPELAALVESYNRLGSVMREERQSL
jgi:two-component system, NtrC family, nitrogen regulation sensor histidine kinase NtrY